VATAWKKTLAYLWLAALALGLPGAARADDLDKQLLRHTPELLRYLRDKGYHNVGVLKFHVKKPNEPLSDHAGTLNMNLARRLEIALVLADDNQSPVGIIQNASAVAAGVPGADHATKAGRQKLFTAQYPLAWGDQRVTPDAFVFGVAELNPGLRDLTVGVGVLGKDDLAMHRVVKFTARTSPSDLSETGESFLVRGIFDRADPAKRPAREPEPAPEQVYEQAAQTAAKVKEAQQAYPLEDRAAPVKLEILYDGKPVPLEIKDGKALIPEPRTGQKVTFVLKRTPGGNERLGVVLKVNGENTLFKQKLKDLDCTKWVLEPGAGPITIKGFQMSDKTAQEFHVLSREESKTKETYYGEDVGTIALVVFREKQDKKAPPPSLGSDEEEDLNTMTRGVFPAKKPANLAALKAQLRTDSTRGLIEGGANVGSGVNRVKFQPDPTPVLLATITYYRP
jgi:hypothetical protein